MTDPHQPKSATFYYSDPTDTVLTPSPAISISPVARDPFGRRVSATSTNHLPSAISRSSPSTRDAEPADDANPASETSVTFGRHDLDPPSVAVHDTDSGNPVTGNNPFNPSSSPSTTLVLAPFGSETWATTFPGPYLDFAPRPIYEPTGELLHEQTDSFERFDTPVNIQTLGATDSNRDSSSSPDAPSVTRISAQTPKAVDVFVQPSLPRSALKRKVELLESPVTEDRNINVLKSSGGRPSKARSVSFERMSAPGPTSPEGGSTTSDLHAGQGRSDQAAHRRTRQSAASTPWPALQSPSGPSQNAGRPNRGVRAPSAHPPSILPAEKVFPIQIGSELFRLSGASISSDAPSYFTQFFEEQIRQNEESGGVRTLYIDRDPLTFRDVARHLQGRLPRSAICFTGLTTEGYHIKPKDGSHFVKLFADAQFYSLPRLIDQLFESEIFIQIGEKNFQIPKDIFSEPGNSPNFFSLGFAVFFSTPGEVFPGLDRRGLLRPPSITPPYVPGRSAEIFAELLHLLRGYPLNIRNEDHRAELLRDCRYFHLRGLEQKIIAHDICYNLERQKHEISLRIEDVKPSGVSFSPDEAETGRGPSGGWVFYARPFVDDTSYEAVIEIGGECTLLDLDDMRADFHNLTKARVSSLFQVVANKMNLPTNAPLGLLMLSESQTSRSASPGHTPLSEDRVKVRFEPATDITLDGESLEIDWDSAQGQTMQHGPPPASSESETESDAMSESTSSKNTSHPSAVASKAQAKRPQGRKPTETVPSLGSPRTTLAVPPIRTRLSGSAPSAKKRKRITGRDQGQMGEWVIRTGQWRLRVQPNPQDTIRGGFEMVFIGVKVDAYSCEHARNSRKSFLGR